MSPENVQAAEVLLLEAATKKIESQRKQAWIVFVIGAVIMIVTVLAPILASLAPVLDIGCKTVTIEGNQSLVCADIKPPWGFTTGLVAGLFLFLAAAAFRQVEVGDVGKRLLEKLPGLGGKKE